MTMTINQAGNPRGVTLIELTVVIFVILSIMGATMYFAGNIGEWNKGKKASAALREVYTAQRAFLADHPRRAVSSLGESELVPYLPSGAASFPAPCSRAHCVAETLSSKTHFCSARQNSS